MRTGRPTTQVKLTPDERQELDSLAHRSRSAPTLERPPASQNGCMSRPRRSASGGRAFWRIDSTGCSTNRDPAHRGGSLTIKWSK